MSKYSSKEFIARRVAKELKDGDIVNLGAGLPVMVAHYLPEGIEIMTHSENGVIGATGAVSFEDRDPLYVNASNEHIHVVKGASIFNSAMSFGIMRGGHLDVTVLGAMQVDEKGNLANWCVKNGPVLGMGGAMDLVAGTKRVIIATEHCDKSGASKIRKECDYPLTGIGVVSLIVTELAVIEVTPEGLVLKEINVESSLNEVIAKTDATLIIPDHIKVMEV
jgi:acetate CoA/acetoacetate CoA-transferase beta subunit